jgi:hypothetical protein
VDDVNNMDESMDAVEQPRASLGRRDFLTKAAAAGAVAWTAPMILSRPAHAQVIGGTPGCSPLITTTCVTHDCGQGQKCFPGIRIQIGPCRCNPGTPVACVRITDLDPEFVAYGDQATCDPPAVAGEVLSTGDWECIDSDETVFFGRPRSGNGNGAIPELGDGTVITFRMAIWAGNCSDETGDPAFECRTIDVSMTWQQELGTCGMASPCTITEADPGDSLCNLPNPGQSPCGSCT